MDYFILSYISGADVVEEDEDSGIFQVSALSNPAVCHFQKGAFCNLARLSSGPNRVPEYDRNGQLNTGDYGYATKGHGATVYVIDT
eukprot:Pgem_evm1s16503